MGDSSKHSHQNQPKWRRERRAVPRIKCSKAFVYASNGDYFRGRISDISANGIGMRVRQRLEPGNVVAILLKKAGLFQSEHFAKVVHVRPEENGTWFVGCEFGTPLTPEELGHFQVVEVVEDLLDDATIDLG